MGRRWLLQSGGQQSANPCASRRACALGSKRQSQSGPDSSAWAPYGALRQMSRHPRCDPLKTRKDRSLPCPRLPWASERALAPSEPLAAGTEDVELVTGGQSRPRDGGEPVVTLELSAEPEQDRNLLGRGRRHGIGLPHRFSSANHWRAGRGSRYARLPARPTVKAETSPLLPRAVATVRGLLSRIRCVLLAGPLSSPRTRDVNPWGRAPSPGHAIRPPEVGAE